MSQFGVDYDAAMAGATLQWRGLKPRWQFHISRGRRGNYGTRLRDGTPSPVKVALRNRGLVFPTGDFLSPMGILVLYAGIAESKRIEALATEV